ncbi:hypothetical protein M5689_007352 [Euphorbia peplus]|nr:hypothetical protein M5689_007352 [Euphorbia peplus]
MVHLRSLLWLLFFFNALKDFSLAQQDGTKFVLAEDNIASTAGKEIVGGFKAARKFGLGRGRKMMIVEEVKRKKEEKEGNDNGKKESENSGKEENDELHKKSLQLQHITINHQEHMKKLKGKTEKCGNLGIPRRKTLIILDKTPKDDSMKGRSSFRSRSISKDEKLVEATKEMASLMNKDYSGFRKAKRKPPINNSIPFH